MNRRQSLAVPSSSNKENSGKAAKIKRAQSIGGPIDAFKSNIGADGLSPRRRKRRSMVPRKSILKSHNDDDEQTMDMTTVVGGIGSDITAGRKSMLSRRVSFAAMAQVRMFEPTTNSHATASSPHPSSSPAPNTPSAETPPARSPVPTRRANSEEVGEASMELDDETPDRSMEADNSFGSAGGGPYDGDEGGGEDSMDLTDTYQLGTPSRRRSSAPIPPLPPLDRSLTRESEGGRDGEQEKEKDGGEFMVKVGKSIAPKRKSEAWAELQSMTHAGPESDDDHTGSTANSDSNVGLIRGSQQTIFSSQGTYSSHGTYSSQESATGTERDGDIPLEDALSRLRAVRQSVGGGAADMSIDEDEGDSMSSSSGDYEGGGYDDERTMDVTAITGGLRFRTDDEDEDVEASDVQMGEGSEPAPVVPHAPAPTFEFTTDPETRNDNGPLDTGAPAKLPTFSIDPPTDEPAPVPPIAQAPATPFAFAIPSSPKAAANPPSSVPLTLPPTTTTPLSIPASTVDQPTSSSSSRPPLTFEVSQSPVRPPLVTWEPRNSPVPFQFALPENGTPRRKSGGLTPNATPLRSVTPVPQGTPKTVEAPARALSAPPTPKRPRDGDENTVAEEPVRKKVALESSEPTAEKEAEAGVGKSAAPVKPPRRRSFAPRASIMGRRVAQDPILPTIPASSPGRASPAPVSRVQSPAPSPRPTTPSRECERELRRQASASPSLTRGSPRPGAASLDEIRVSSPLRSRTSGIGANMGLGAKSPAQWRNGVQNEAELDEVPSISASDFLKMTRISFMDGLTVKRRSTVGLGVLSRGENQPSTGLADYITAMTVGVPQLETFTYAAKELKEYISNGKKAIRILEDDLDANNPYLFKEYLASGEEDRRAIEETLGGHKEAMRMRSKMSWYKWRHGFVQEMQAAADQETELLQQDLESLRSVGTQLSEPIPSLREQHAKLKAQLAAERAAVEAVKDCDPEAMEELMAGISEQNTQIDGYKADVQSSTAKLEKLKAKLEEIEGEKRALLEQMRVHQEQLDALHPTVEIVNLRDEFEKLQRLHLWQAVKIEDKYVELVYDSRYRVQMDCVGYRPIPSGCRVQPIPLKGQQRDQFPALTELVLDLAQTMLQQAKSLNLKKVVRMLGRLWTSISHLRCNLRLLAMKYPVTIIRTPGGFGFKAITCVRFPRSKGLAKVTFTASEQHAREWGRQLHTMGADVDIVYGNLDRDLILEVVKERISEAVIEESYGLMLDACADAVACAEE
ncbi:kinetochore protein spc7 [Ceratobasidium sp. AG-Ba]|nr:kinetochore protein spc7 [Ceratobasidium sp. AG-Ba]